MLRDNAATLDVEDVVDLCYATEPDDLRVAIYLEALRGRGGEKAQLAACLLCFDLARRGDERREAELHLLLPAIDAIIERDLAGEPTAVQVLIDNSMTVVELWTALRDHARYRDKRAPPTVPDFDDLDDIDIDLFDEDEVAELAFDLGEIDLALDLDEEVLAAFDTGLNRLIPPHPSTLFCGDTGGDLERIARLREHAASFADKLPIAADMEVYANLFTATHTRALGIFGRRNKARDKSLAEGLRLLLAMPAPPVMGTTWFEAKDLPGSEPGAWPKIAEVLLDLISFVGTDVDKHPERYGPWLTQREWAAVVSEAFVADARSARIPQRLLEPGDRRRRQR
ncbi:MAG TPA: hypothetical protein VGF99_16350 [Myxococcota bacterium]